MRITTTILMSCLCATLVSSLPIGDEGFQSQVSIIVPFRMQKNEAHGPTAFIVFNNSLIGKSASSSQTKTARGPRISEALFLWSRALVGLLIYVTLIFRREGVAQLINLCPESSLSLLRAPEPNPIRCGLL